MSKQTQNNFKDFTYAVSCDLEERLLIKIGKFPEPLPEDYKISLEDLCIKDQEKSENKDSNESLSEPAASNAKMPEELDLELVVSCYLYTGKQKLIPVSQSTLFNLTKKIRNTVEFNEILTFPIRYNQLPFDARLEFRISSYKDESFGTACFYFYKANGLLKTGLYRILLKTSWSSGDEFEDRKPSEQDLMMDKFERLQKKYERGDFPKLAGLKWLDNKSLEVIEAFKDDYFTNVTDSLFLYIELPSSEIPILYKEREYFEEPKKMTRNTSSPLLPRATSSHSLRDQTHVMPVSLIQRINKIYDPDMYYENLVEIKHRRLTRSHRTDHLDRELKPNAKIRDELIRICKYPPTKNLSSEESDLVWKFRFHLTKNKQALTKFLKAVDWNDAVETKQATEVLLKQWVDIQVDDALELFGPQFPNKKVREYAVRQLEKSEDEDLLLYLLQLVQAIKFEELDEGKAAFQSPLVEFLTTKSIKNPILGNFFYWYLMSEIDDPGSKKVYGKVAYHFMKKMEESNQDSGVGRREVIKQQAELIDRLSQLTKSLRQSKESRPKKIENLKALIADPKSSLSNFPPIPLPLDPTVSVTGIVADKTSIFKSTMLPLKLYFKTVSGIDYPLMFKIGDDLRQDQLIMQVITLMDKLLKKENLDLKLTPYRILSTGNQCGMIQFIPSHNLSSILSKYNSNIQAFLRDKASDAESNETFQIKKTVFDTYIRSCAGYAVISYLLGIGDRHLDNLLMTDEGHLFHIDFGYILGRDPKPFPPPMKLCKEMVDCMGGTQSIHFQEFRSLTHTAYLILRKNSNLILNLFSLMVEASIPDIQVEPDKCVFKVQEKFKLDVSEEEAINHLDKLLADSLNALFPQLIETVHKWAQYWRK